MGGTPHPMLEEQLGYFEELDASRTAFSNWRDEGREALTQLLTHKGLPVAAQWDDSLDVGNRALLITALSRHPPAAAVVAREARALGETALVDLLGHRASSALYARNGAVTFLDAARALEALSSAPSGAFARATMYFYYAVIRELYFASDPGWSVGGARAGAGGQPSAYATAQLVEGVISFKRMLQRTGAYVAAIGSVLTRPISGVDQWNAVDAERWNIAARIRMEQSASNLAFAIESPLPARPADSQRDLETFLDATLPRIPEGLDLAVETFDTAVSEIRRFRDEEVAAATSRATHRLVALSEGAHAVALGAVADAADRARNARDLFQACRRLDLSNGREREQGIRQYARALDELKTGFDDAARGTAKLLQPTLKYASSVLDHELAAAGNLSATFEPAEMAAAAAAYGAASDDWTEARLVRAAEVLSSGVTEHGFPIGRPFHTVDGTYYQPAQPFIIMYYAYLLQHTRRAAVSAEAMQRIEHYFRSTKEPLGARASAWRWEFGETPKRSPFHTAITTLTVTRLARMLDERINDAVLQHFVSRAVKGPTLDQLFYPDYGLASNVEPGRPKRQSVAVILERMRAHIVGVDLGEERVYSLVLHGPPGTGKTTLVEALAASSGTRLVEVTPSDIVLRGADRVEERARAVLRALALLTRAVILFDEFDSVLRSRVASAETADDAARLRSDSPNVHVSVVPHAQTIFDFLSGGMLPKLKHLYERARTRRVAYVLATNFLKALDTAAIREGRFDKTLGIYPPDILSRAGRLWNLLQEEALQRKVHIDGQTLAPRAATVLSVTKDASMPALMKPGWFRREGDKYFAGTPLAFVFGDSSDEPQPADRRPTEREETQRSMTPEERAEYTMIVTWDERWQESPFGPAIESTFATGVPALSAEKDRQ